MNNMAFRPKVNDDTMNESKPDGNQDDVVDLTSQSGLSQQKPTMRFDPSTFGSSSLASKLPSFLEELARANRETEQMMASNPKAARMEIDDDDDDEEIGDRPVIEMNLYSGIFESEDPNEKKGEKKEIVMPNGQPFAGGDGDEPFISEPVNVRRTTNNDRKRRASTSSSSSASGGSSSSSEGETRVIKLPIPILPKEGSLAESQASTDGDSVEHTGGSCSRKEKVPPPPKKKMVARKGDGSLPSSSLKDQDVKDWVDSQPSTTGEYDEIEGAPKRKMLIPHTRVSSKESKKNTQDWVDKQVSQNQQANQ